MEDGKKFRCMNASCGAAEDGGEWSKGWVLRSGGLATLCGKCGTAYEQSIFCDKFHVKESGWRQCGSCGKRLHCGCVASKASVCLLDHGGVQCIGCSRNLDVSPASAEVIQDFLPRNSSRDFDLLDGFKDERVNVVRASVPSTAYELQHASPSTKVDMDISKKVSITPVEKNFELKAQSRLFPVQKASFEDSENGSFGILGRDQVALFVRETRSVGLSIRNQPCVRDDYRDTPTDKIMPKSSNQAGPSIFLGTSNPCNVMETGYNVEFPHNALVSSGIVMDVKDENKGKPNFQSWHKAQNLLSISPKITQTAASEASKNTLPSLRLARPPAEGRGRNQLLPRYWPRITDQELRQISGDSNATIVPLFEKVLSASDAGRIGRLVLPKACAEAYFPPISQPEGLPLKIQDIKGKEWHFQFRFWPNNNSRMYVLEGVTPCIQSLQLQAGDTVTFSRIDPEGKLVMGFRKATNLQDPQISVTSNAALGNETFFSAVGDNISFIRYSGLLQSVRGAEDPNPSCLSDYLNSSEGDMSWSTKADKYRTLANESFNSEASLLSSEKNQSRIVGTKSKRLHMDSEDALELRITWEEAQDLLRPPPSSKPSVVVIEDQEFEEYEEPPVFVKHTIFTERLSGEQDQWIQCDECLKWRQIPVDVLPPPKWACGDNNWDSKRSCAMPEELSKEELRHLLQQDTDIRRHKLSSPCFKQIPLDHLESSGDFQCLGAAASGVAGLDHAMMMISSVATTAKHPRHRPGCTCIVCIQPPSGKGPKHDPSCVCTVCLTIKRRFQTLMMRKKKRHCDQLEEPEAEAVQHSARLSCLGDRDSGPLDLNCQPEDLRFQSSMSMRSLVQAASRPLETYMKHSNLMSLARQRSSSATPPPDGAPSTATSDNQAARVVLEDVCFVAPAAAGERETNGAAASATAATDEECSRLIEKG